MVIGILTLELDIPAATSLKDKRQIIKSVQRRLRNQFNVSVAEIDLQDTAQSAVLAVAAVGSDKRYVTGLLTKAGSWVSEARLDCVIFDQHLELL